MANDVWKVMETVDVQNSNLYFICWRVGLREIKFEFFINEKGKSKTKFTMNVE